MSNRHNRKYGVSRRLGVNLWGREKDPFARKNSPPGAHGATLGYKRSTDYGMQLKAKQKLKFYYYMSEKQFKLMYQEAKRLKGDTSENLVGLLESRLGSFVYRSKIAPTPFAARQIVNHCHVMINGKIVNKPNYILKPGDVVTVRDSSKNIPMILQSLESENRSLPEYIQWNNKETSATYLKVPNFAEVPYPCLQEPSLVVQLYSR